MKQDEKPQITDRGAGSASACQACQRARATGRSFRTGTFATLTALLLVSACGAREEDRIAFDGIYFAARTATLGDDLADFTTTIEGVSAGVHAALEAGRYEGTKYCIANYGTSDIEWSVGPETEPENLVITEDTITLQGRCDP